MLSIIIPTFNEMGNGYLNKILPMLNQIDGIEVIIVDGHSTDGTVEYINRFSFKLIQVETTSRGKRLNIGMQKRDSNLTNIKSITPILPT